MDTAEIIAALRDRARKFVSLDTPQNQDLGDVAADIGAGFVPGVGTLQSARDLERARREGDGLGMGLAGLGLIPFVGGVTKAAGALRKGAKVADKVGDAAPALREVIEAAAKHADDASGAAKRGAYVGGHKAPMKGSGAPLHELTQVYPDDIYSARAVQYYGTGDQALDRGTFRKVNAYKGNPDAPVTMYRAVPSSVPEGAAINNGDWVTINPDYAKMHGEGPLGGDYRVLQQQVPARKLFTNGDSIHEFGYDESGKISPALLGLIAGTTATGLTVNALRDKKKKESDENPKTFR